MQPTDIEYIFDENTTMVTKTDLNGIITYANDDFVRASGYLRSELIGKPHNIVRHPSMPGEAFKDLWATLKNHRPWTGFVKNMRKNGDFYWVKANVTPHYQDGQLVGYMSVRTKPTQHEINEITKIYKLFTDNKAKGLVIKDGHINRTGFFAKCQFAFTNITIRKRIFIVVALLSVALLTISFLGLNNLSKDKENFNELYESRMIPIDQLADIQRIILENRLLITSAILDSNLIDKNVLLIESNIAEVTKLWQAYRLTYLTPEETIMADKFELDRKKFVAEGLKPAEQALRNHDITLANQLIVEKIRPLYPLVNDDIKNLKNLQIQIAKQFRDDANDYFHVIKNIFLGLIIFSVLLALIMGELLIRSLVQMFREFGAMVYSGSVHNLIDNSKRDEFSAVRDAFKISQIETGFELLCQKQMADENLRIKIGLDTVSTGVMIADDNGEIIYANKSVEQILHIAESDIQKELPHFNANKLVGSNIDSFHKNPQIQKNLLANLTENQRTSSNIQVGGRSLVVTASPILSKNTKRRLGTVAEWQDRTIEITVEHDVERVIDSISLGDFSQRIDENGKKEFILTLSKAINHLVETFSGSLNEIVNVLNSLSKGDLTRRINSNYSGIFGELKDDVNSTVESLTRIVEEIKFATDNINVNAKEIAAGNNDLSERTEKQATNLEKTSINMQGLTTTVQHNAQNAKEANQLAITASDVAGAGVEVIGKVVMTMDEISHSSRKIGDIISVIDDIAFQTNILALNAAVEAARAGEQGKGFAVVAVEVRNLAQRATLAAGEIKNLIDDSVSKVHNGTLLVKKAGDTMGEIVTSIQGVTNKMSEITLASEEQSDGIQQVNKAVSEMEEVTQQNAALVEQSAASSEMLEDQARSLFISVGHFKL